MGGGHFYVFIFNIFQSILSIFVFFLFWLKKLNIFMDLGPPPQLAENSTKIINLIFEPLPKGPRGHIKFLKWGKILDQNFEGGDKICVP